MTRLPHRLLPFAAAVVLGLSACGSDEGDTETGGSAAATPEATQTPAATETPAAGTGATKISKDTESKPEIPKPTGEPPTELVKRDIVKGKGPAAKAGDQVTVQYVGVSYSTGEQFDASWDNGQPFPFALGEGQVIPGWDQGVPGMKVGGRRELVIPPEMAYGAAGSPPAIGPNETLIFVVDVVDIKPFLVSTRG